MYHPATADWRAANAATETNCWRAFRLQALVTALLDMPASLAIAGLPANATVISITPVPGYTLQAQVRPTHPLPATIPPPLLPQPGYDWHEHWRCWKLLRDSVPPALEGGCSAPVQCYFLQTAPLCLRRFEL